MSTAHEYQVKWERLMNAVEFRPTDRLPVSGASGTVVAIQRITGRQDYRTNTKAVFAQPMKETPHAQTPDAGSRGIKFPSVNHGPVAPPADDEKTRDYGRLSVRVTSVFSEQA
jgi:hypothetical protein